MSTPYTREFAPQEPAPGLEPTTAPDAEVDIVPVAQAGPATTPSEETFRVITADALKWNPDTLDPRRRMAPLLGDLAAPGPYTVRIQAPANYVIGLHRHPDDDEQLTVISGTIRFSLGNPGSGEPEYTIGAGGFTFTPAGMPHRVVAVEDCVLQMSGVGPRSYEFLDETEDPRRTPPAPRGRDA